MPIITFLPVNKSVDVEPQTKILAAAIRNKIPIRFGCGACQCGTCGVQVKVDGELSAMKEEEKSLLARMRLQTDGHIRLACQTKIISGVVTVDLDFQDKYDPDAR